MIMACTIDIVADKLPDVVDPLDDGAADALWVVDGGEDGAVGRADEPMVEGGAIAVEPDDLPGVVDPGGVGDAIALGGDDGGEGVVGRADEPDAGDPRIEGFGPDDL